jgi:iron-sulfur cluster repair protein YtfE (RIC family)
MKASALLKEQHDEVKATFKQLEKGDGRAPFLLEKLANSLAAHMVIEQELFYPAIMNVKEDLVLESYEEHAVARFALKRLMKTEPSDRTFKAKLTTLKELIEHHVEEEESDLFPKAEKALGDTSEELCRQMKSLFEKTAKAGYEQAMGRGGSAVTSATAPVIDHA